jgi:hypothetical protein
VPINPSISLFAWSLNPMRATIAVRKSPPRTDELTARNGKAERTDSAAKANELFMKSAVERCSQYLPAALLSNRRILSARLCAVVRAGTGASAVSRGSITA